MFFPVLRSKRFELLALRDLSDDIVANGNVLPVIEPMAANRDLELAFDAFIKSTMSFCLIVNPEVGQFAGMPISSVKHDVFDALLPDYENVMPTMYVKAGAQTTDIVEFRGLFPGARAFFFLEDAPADVIDEVVSSDPAYVLFRRDANITPATKLRFPSAISVDIAESFVQAGNNSAFPDDESYSTSHLTTPNENFSHFGDYSIIGRDLMEGWAPYCVVIHYLFIEGASPGPLRIKHYKSDTNATQSDPAGKYAEALQKLIVDIGPLGLHNSTSATAQYIQDDATHHFPGLGTLKRRGIVHHFRLIFLML